MVLDHATIDATASEFDDALIALRREIHRWPELAGEERRTATLVADHLREAGLAVTTGVGGHGVVALLTGDGDGPTVAYRADMDAVEDRELFDSDVISQVPGVAHLCGHDLHTSIGVGVARVLARRRDQLRGRVIFVFQPAEETLSGARAMIDAGALDESPAEIYALHCGPLPVGGFAVMPGNGLPGQDHYRIELPDATGSAQLVAAIQALGTVERPRSMEEFAQLLSDLLVPDGPLAQFVFVQSGQHMTGEQAEIRVWVRAWPDGRYPELRDEVSRLVAAAGGRVESPAPPFPAMVCSPELSEAAATYLRGALGQDAVGVLHAALPFNGEDFALFLQEVPGAMFYLGVANPDAGMNGIPHSPDFAADERAIGIGVRAMAGFLTSRLAARSQ